MLMQGTSSRCHCDKYAYGHINSTQHSQTAPSRPTHCSHSTCCSLSASHSHFRASNSLLLAKLLSVELSCLSVRSIVPLASCLP